MNRLFQRRQKQSATRVEYKKLDDRRIKILTYHEGEDDPIETIADITPPRRNLRDVAEHPQTR